MRKPVVLTYMLVCVISLLAGINAFAQTEIVVWMYQIGPDGGRRLYDEVVIPSFKEKHPDIDLQIQVRPWTNRDESMLLGFLTGTGPDIAYLNLDFFERFIDEGMLEPLDSHISEVDRSEYFPQVVDAVTFDGQLYGMPLLQQLVTYFYNATMFEETGLDPNAPPTNWEELEETANRLTRRTSDGGQERWGAYIAMPTDTTNMTFNPFLWQAGGDIFTPDGKQVAFDGPEGVEALTFLADLYRTGALTNADLFSQGRVGMRLGTANDHGTILTGQNLPFEWFPGPVLQHRERISYGTLGSLAMFSNSRNKEAAALVMEHMTSTEIMGALMKSWGYIGPKHTMDLAIYGDQGDWMKVFMDNIDYTHYDITHPLVRDVFRVLAPAVNRAIRLEVPPPSALEDAARQANALLADYVGR